MKYIIALFFLCLPMGLFAKNHTPEQILQMINGKGGGMLLHNYMLMIAMSRNGGIMLSQRLAKEIRNG
jgi:hypothetical protein